MQKCHVHIFGFDYLKDFFEDDVYFLEDFEACMNHMSRDGSPQREILLQDFFSRTMNYVSLVMDDWKGILVWTRNLGS